MTPTEEVCRQLLQTINEATGNSSYVLPRKKSRNKFKTRSFFWDDDQCSVATPLKRIPTALLSFSSGHAVSSPRDKQPFSPKPGVQHGSALFERCLELASDAEYQARCKAYAKDAREHAKHLQAAVERRQAGKQAIAVQFNQEHKLIYEKAQELMEKALDQKQAALTIKELKAERVRQRMHNAWMMRVATEPSIKWLVIIMQTLSFQAFIEFGVQKNVLSFHMLPWGSKGALAQVRVTSTAHVLRFLRFLRWRQKSEPLKVAVGIIQRRVTTLQRWIRGFHQCRGACLELLQLQWDKVMSKLQVDAKAVTEQRLQAYSKNYLFWADTLLDTSTFHFPRLEWPKALQAKLLQYHLSKPSDVTASTSLSAAEASSSVPQVVVNAPQDEEQGSSANSQHPKSNFSKELQSILLQQGWARRTERRKGDPEIVPAEWESALDEIQAMENEESVDPMVTRMTEKEGCIRAYYWQRSCEHHLAFREWFELCRRAQRPERMTVCDVVRQLQHRRSSGASSNATTPTNRRHAFTQPYNDGRNRGGLRSALFPKHHPFASESNPTGAHEDFKGHHTMDARGTLLHVAPCTGRPIRRPPMHRVSLRCPSPQDKSPTANITHVGGNPGVKPPAPGLSVNEATPASKIARYPQQSPGCDEQIPPCKTSLMIPQPRYIYLPSQEQMASVILAYLTTRPECRNGSVSLVWT